MAVALQETAYVLGMHNQVARETLIQPMRSIQHLGFGEAGQAEMPTEPRYVWRKGSSG